MLSSFARSWISSFASRKHSNKLNCVHVEKLVVDEAGNVLRVELHSPFSYLSKADDWIAQQEHQPTEANNDPGVETEKAS